MLPTTGISSAVSAIEFSFPVRGHVLELEHRLEASAPPGEPACDQKRSNRPSSFLSRTLSGSIDLREPRRRKWPPDRKLQEQLNGWKTS
jgi:hypothetical protein